MNNNLNHFDDEGAARMVGVGLKPATLRIAVAEAEVRMKRSTSALVRKGRGAKGNVLEIARVAGICAAKHTATLIPLCHPLALTKVEVDFTLSSEKVRIVARAEAVDRTGVEMEALTAASVAALTIYDMCKAVDRGMEIARIRLLEKSGGKSGRYVRGRTSK